MFNNAVRHQAFVRIALLSLAGGGKTFSALRLAKGLSERAGKRIALIDTQDDAACYYAESYDFDTAVIQPPYKLSKFFAAIKCAAESGEYAVLIIDTISHVWAGIMEHKDSLDKKGGNPGASWGEADRMYRQFFSLLAGLPIHVICTVRCDADYGVSEHEGKRLATKTVLAPLMKRGVEFEFATVIEIDQSTHNACVTKDATRTLATDAEFQITAENGETLYEYCSQAKTKPAPQIVPEIWTNDSIHLIEEKMSKRGEQPVTFYLVIFSSGKRAGTFSKTIVAHAKSFGEGAIVNATVKDGRKPDTFELIEIELATPPENAIQPTPGAE